jgi:hypothetical protein
MKRSVTRTACLVAGFLLVFSWFHATAANAGVRHLPAYGIANLSTLAPGFRFLGEYLNDAGEVEGTLEGGKTNEAEAFVFDGHKLVPLGSPKAYSLTIVFGISSAGSVLALATKGLDEPQAAYLATPNAKGYAWSRLPFDPLNGNCRPLIAANGDIAGGTPKTPCAVWQRLADGRYAQPVSLANSPGYEMGSLTSIWTSGRHFVVGGVQRAHETFPSLWSPKPSLQTSKPSTIYALGGTVDHLFAVGADAATAVSWQVRFDSSGEAHLGVLHELGLPGTGRWKNVGAAGVTTDASGKMIAVGVGTPDSGKSQQQALIWHGTQPAMLQSVVPAGSGWILSTAMAINQSGQILGTGVFKGKNSTYLLTPTQN